MGSDIMGDIICAKCGEPWDYYGLKHGDVEMHEVRPILNGEGCPCCDFGNDKDKCKNGFIIKHFASLLNNSEGDELAQL